MFRRSLRLQLAGYYTAEGLPYVSYKEILYKVFHRRKYYNCDYHERDRGNHNEPLGHPDSVADNYHQFDDQEDTHDQTRITVAENNSGTSALTSSTQTRIPHTLTAGTQATETLTKGTQASLTWTTGTQATCTTTGTQTMTAKRKAVRATCSCAYKMFICVPLLLLAFGFTHMHMQMAEIQQEVLSLRRQMNAIFPLADTLPNFALKSQGASVCRHSSSDTYWPQDFGMIMNRVFNWLYTYKQQTNVIRGHSSLHPGECWAFAGERGHLVISLSHCVAITHVTLGHIMKSQAPSGFIASALREFSIFGMKTTDDEGTYLGRLVYNQDGPAFQTFELSNPCNVVFRYVKLQIENNWGNKDYTCLYSFRVHGKLPI